MVAGEDTSVVGHESVQEGEERAPQKGDGSAICDKRFRFEQ